MKGGTLPMYDHSWKKKGLIISSIGVICMIAERLKKFTIIPRYDPSQHYGLFKWLMLLGLIIVIFSKEKVEDDRTQAIRRKAYQMGFYIMVAILMAQAATGITNPKMVIDVNTLFFIAGLGILFYLAFFHIGLYYDFLWEYEDRSVLENLQNIPKNKLGRLVFLIISGVIILLLAIICYLPIM